MLENNVRSRCVLAFATLHKVVLSSQVDANGHSSSMACVLPLLGRFSLDQSWIRYSHLILITDFILRIKTFLHSSFVVNFRTHGRWC